MYTWYVWIEYVLDIFGIIYVIRGRNGLNLTINRFR